MFKYFRGIIDKRKKKKEHIERMTHIYNQASEGDCASLYELGMMFENGLGVERSLEKASDCYLRAANKGMLAACRKLGTWCDEGFTGNRDVSQAIHWYRICSQSNNLDDAIKFSMLCTEYRGELSDEDINIVSETLELLNENKDPDGMFGLALLCERGLIKCEDINIEELMKLAAFKGQIRAQLWMGDKSSHNNIKEAIRWYDIAAKNGSRDALTKINQLRESS